MVRDVIGAGDDIGAGEKDRWHPVGVDGFG